MYCRLNALGPRPLQIPRFYNILASVVAAQRALTGQTERLDALMSEATLMPGEHIINGTRSEAPPPESLAYGYLAAEPPCRAAPSLQSGASQSPS